MRTLYHTRTLGIGEEPKVREEKPPDGGLGSKLSRQGAFGDLDQKLTSLVRRQLYESIFGLGDELLRDIKGVLNGPILPHKLQHSIDVCSCHLGALADQARRLALESLPPDQMKDGQREHSGAEIVSDGLSRRPAPLTLTSRRSSTT